MKKILCVVLLVSIIVVSNAFAASNNLWVSLSTSNAVYSENDNFKLFISLGNFGETRNVDLYIILEHDGHYYSFPEYNEGFKPVLRNFNFSSGLSASNILIHDVSLPSTVMPPVYKTGNYIYYAVFTEPGTTLIIGDIESIGFTYNSSASISGNYDGIWEGTAVSSVHTDFCKGTSIAKFIVIDNIIDGSASEITGEGYSFRVTGRFNTQGKIEDGVIWYRSSHAGSFEGSVDAADEKHISGTWRDIYGCYGTFSATKK